MEQRIEAQNFERSEIGRCTYTLQENGHVESFHAILGRDLKGLYFENLFGLEAELKDFYRFYNFERIHGSTLKLPPVTFWYQWNLGNVNRTVLDIKNRKVKFTLKGAKIANCHSQTCG